MEYNLIERYLEKKEVDLVKATTLDIYRATLNTYLKYFDSSKDSINEIAIKDIKEYIFWLKDKGRVRNSISLIIGIIKNFHRWLLTESLIKRDIMETVTRPRLEETSIRLPGAPDIKRLEEAAVEETRRLEDRLLFLLIKETGMRSSEVCDLKTIDINLTDNLIYIRTSKGKVFKVLAITKRTARLLKRHIIERPSPNAHVFWYKRKGLSVAINRSYIYTKINRFIYSVFPKTYWKAAGLSSGGHLLRHICATEWIEKGGNLIGLKELMGWRSFAQFDRYVHRNPLMVRQRFNEVHGDL